MRYLVNFSVFNQLNFFYFQTALDTAQTDLDTIDSRLYLCITEIQSRQSYELLQKSKINLLLLYFVTTFEVNYF